MLDPKKIRQFRLRKRPGYPNGMTAIQLAAEMGVATPFVYLYERCSEDGYPFKSPSIYVVERFAEALGCEVTDLLSPDPKGYKPFTRNSRQKALSEA